MARFLDRFAQEDSEAFACAMGGATPSHQRLLKNPNT